MLQIEDFTSFEIDVFDIIEKEFLIFFKHNFSAKMKINHCTEENKILLMNFVKGIVQNNQDTDLKIHQVIIAVLFAFYALVLLELMGDNVCLEEMCRYMRVRSDRIKKIQDIYYAIIWGDEPLYAEIRGRMLIPERYKSTFLFSSEHNDFPNI